MKLAEAGYTDFDSRFLFGGFNPVSTVDADDNIVGKKISHVNIGKASVACKQKKISWFLQFLICSLGVDRDTLFRCQG